MENRIYGILLIGIASIIYWLAFKKYKASEYSYCIFLITLGGLILRVFTSFDFYLHDWDERFHALVAKNLISHPFTPMLYVDPILDYDYKNWAGNHIWVHKQPFPLYAMALSMWLFGKNVIALRLPSIILSTIAIFMTYKVGRNLVSIKAGLIAAFLFSINGLIIEQVAGRVATDHIDVFFVSLISIAVYFLLGSTNTKNSYKFIFGSVFTGLAILTKWLPALIVFPIWFIYAYKKLPHKQIAIYSFIFLMVVGVLVIPWQLYIMHAFPLEASWEYSYNKMHFLEVLGPHGQPFYFHFDRMRIIFGELVYLPLGWLIYTYFTSNENRRTHLILLVWILVPYLFFSIAKTKMQGYILLSAPAICIMIAHFYLKYANRIKRNNVFITVTLSLLLILPIRYSIERIKPFSNNLRTKNWISEIKQIDRSYNHSKKVLFNTKHPIATMFYTDFTAYDKTPNKDQVLRFQSEGYEIFIDNDQALPDGLRRLPGVNYIALSDEKY